MRQDILILPVFQSNAPAVDTKASVLLYLMFVFLKDCAYIVVFGI